MTAFSRACVLFLLMALTAGSAQAQVITEFSAGLSPDAQPHNITAGPDGNLWFTEPSAGRIGRITPAGVITEFSAGISPNASPRGITSGPDGNLWFTEVSGHRIGRITLDGVVTEFSVGISPNSYPDGITAGPDGNLWFAEGANRVGRITPAGVITEFSAGISSGAGLSDITTGPDGNLWFTESNAHRIGRITPGGVVTEFSDNSTAGAGPYGVTAGPDGNLWFLQSPFLNRPGTRGWIGRISPLGVITYFYAGISPDAYLGRIMAGPDGNLWFTEGSKSQIGRITPAGVITEFGAGLSPNAWPYGITSGPDGNLWFTESSAQSSGNRIGKVTLAASPNYQGLWWVPGGAENFWGINFAHQGDQVFGTWYTYDSTGKAWWSSMLAGRGMGNTYTGPIYVDTGPPFHNFVGTGVPTAVGSGTLAFTDANNGSFSYNLDAGTGGSPVAVTQTKPLTRFDLGTGPQPVCTFSATADLAAGTNYQDLWWAASGAESGWGINFAHQGSSIFATWYTYDSGGAPLWLSALLQRQGSSNVYTGPMTRTSGPRFDNYKPGDVVQPIPTVGTATVTFANGNSATFNYTTNGAGGLPAGVNQTKAIVRYPFGPGGTVCSGPTPVLVTVQSPTPSPWVGESMLLTAIARDASGAVIPGTTASWSTSDPGIATVSATGVFQGLATGTVVVTATIAGVSGTQSLTVTPMPRISVSLGATKEVIFDYTRDHCSDLDTPDLPTHVVRAEDGSLVLFAGDAPRFYVSRGADFGSFKRDCSQPALQSADQRTPESYENWEWISAVYREDTRWHALISNEFHDAAASTCRPGDPSPANPCLYNSSTYAVSTDGAHSFLKPFAPAHVVAPPPNVWEPPLPGAMPNAGWQFVEGYFAPTSIVRKDDGYFYGVVGLIPSKAVPPTFETCLIRTDDLDDPASWRAWDGSGFNVRMTSPYVTGSPAPTCKLSHDAPGGNFTFNTYLDRYMEVGNYRHTSDGKPVCGVYFALSADLFHWSAQQLIVEVRDDGWCPFDPQKPGLLETVPVMYITVIDHADMTVNFERPGRTAYLYYTRFNDGGLDRDLVRVPLTFTRLD